MQTVNEVTDVQDLASQILNHEQSLTESEFTFTIKISDSFCEYEYPFTFAGASDTSILDLISSFAKLYNIPVPDGIPVT